MIVLDASVLIAYLDESDAHHVQALKVLSTTERYRIHTLTLAEVLVRPTQAGRAVELIDKITAIGIRELERVPDEARQLADMRVSTPLKTPDCCVLMAATAHAASLASFDERLRDVARSRGLHVLP
ncbi:PIN domain-containing protein [Nocardioides sp.]|uniref:type II toxin-antitoxin system VapC family toxin n=1 Tax=Nocardioides sp. TaxID=35761 RepID=UPI00198D4F27|nr:PIN domain-containing protein [Nocardioides sp.]MBC7279231.1 type II toxin-antitoxin system VapC family toxin [Nocardioides sp.]